MHAYSQKYLRLSAEDKLKYRSIEALPRGYIIGVALIDHSFYLSPDDIKDPWVSKQMVLGSRDGDIEQGFKGSTLHEISGEDHEIS